MKARRKNQFLEVKYFDGTFSDARATLRWLQDHCLQFMIVLDRPDGPIRIMKIEGWHPIFNPYQYIVLTDDGPKSFSEQYFLEQFDIISGEESDIEKASKTEATEINGA